VSVKFNTACHQPFEINRNKYSLSLILSKLIAGKASIVAVAPDSVCPTFDARKNRHEIVN
jgi:hypothetical protein